MGTVIPFPGVVLAAAPVEPPPPPRREEYTCAVCDMTTGDGWDWNVCHACEAWIHSACYWGRVASLEEWRDFVRWSDDGGEGLVPTLCPTCRAATGSA
jgi:hypothetical protein